MKRMRKERVEMSRTIKAEENVLEKEEEVGNKIEKAEYN